MTCGCVTGNESDRGAAWELKARGIHQPAERAASHAASTSHYHDLRWLAHPTGESAIFETDLLGDNLWGLILGSDLLAAHLLG